MPELTLRRSALRRRMRQVGEWAETTPGRLRVATAAVVVVTILAGLAVGAVTTVRRHAADTVATRDEPLMVEADDLYASLADADATAATTFLRGGQEPADLRARYLADLRRASAQLADLGRRVEGRAEARSVAVAAGALPTYSGLVETARANNRQGFPVGAAYLRQASDLMRARILPAAGRLYAAQARRLGDHQRTGTSPDGLAAVLIPCLAMLAVLVGAQVFLFHRTHRVFNIPLAAASLVVVVLMAWAAIAMVSARDSLARAQRGGSDAVQVLSAARLLWLRAQADESLALVARGSATQYVTDADSVIALLQPPAGLLATASRLAARTRSEDRVRGLTTTLGAIRDEHARVARLETAGQFGPAIRLAVGTGSREAALGDALNRRFGALIGEAQGRFEAAAQDARSALSGLAIAIPLLLVVAAGLALFGLQQRLDEYR
jgi:hypothetical protein